MRTTDAGPFRYNYDLSLDLEPLYRLEILDSILRYSKGKIPKNWQYNVTIALVKSIR